MFVFNFILFALFLFLLPLLCFTISRYGRRQGGTPAPQSYPVIGNIVGLLCNLHRFHDWTADLISGAGGGLTIKVEGFLGLDNIICTVDPENLRHIFKSNFHNYAKGNRLKEHLRELLGDGIFNVDGHLWNVQRKIASYEFNTRSIKIFISETVEREISGRLVPLLSDASNKDQIVDLQAVFHRFAFDNICNLAFGVDPTCLEDSISAGDSRGITKAVEFARCFDDATDICMARMMMPLQAIWKIQRFLCVGSERRLKHAVRIIDNFAMEIIRSKEEKMKWTDLDANSEEKLDLLSRFMRANIEMELNTAEEKRKFFRDIIVSFILAGKDSTSTALTWFFWLLSGHRRIERRIHDEISSAGDLKYDDLKSFNYLHAALSESMRLFPPVPLNSRVAVNDDIMPDGARIRRGWAADYAAYSMGKMEKVWGPDCREFRPERWLDGGGNFQACEQFKYPVFHGGPRVCLGKDMAYVQMKAVAVAVVRNFEVVAVDGGATPEKMRSPPYQLDLLLKKKDGFQVKLRRRK